MDAEVKSILDAIWVVTAAILVFFMQAGFALVESGMVRAKNCVNVIMKNYCDMCVGALGFWAIGYGLMFGSNPSGWVGTSKFALNSAEPFEFTLLFFQMMFAATAATIVSGALAERIRFSAYLIGSLIVTSVIYPIFGSWAWNETGWLKANGFIDFAGSTVVHSMGGWIALAGMIVLGPRLGRFDRKGAARDIPGHNLPYVALGGLILWFGWFGFNAGSTTAADVSIGKIALNTHLAAAAGVVGTIVLRAFAGRPPLLSTVVNGSLGGLVAITAGCAFVSPGAAILIGIVASLLIPIGNEILERLKLDDAVGAVPVHGLCGVWGTLAVSIFKSPETVGGGIVAQLMGVGVAFVFAFPTAFIMYKLISIVVDMRVRTLDEQRGLDYAEHSEIGYPEFQDGQLHSGGMMQINDDAPISVAGRY